MRILVTNDDGIYAPGLAALADAVAPLGEVQVVAPLAEQSGVSHSITYLTPLLARKVDREGKFFGHAVAGSPADCVKLAVLELCDVRPDLVVSGINSGSNSGIDVLYSGTVAAAIEGAFFGIPSIAVSLTCDAPPDFPRATRLALGLIAQILALHPQPGSLWNVNLPDSRPGWPVGVKLLPISLARDRDVMIRRVDPRGRTYYWPDVDERGASTHHSDTDVEALTAGFATITPMQFDLTHRARLAELASYPWTLPE